MHFGFIHFVNYILRTYTLKTYTFWNYISSIYHRHIEHFFHIFGGSTVFSLISNRPVDSSSCPWLGWVSFPLRVSCLMMGQGTEFHSSTSQKKNKVYIPVTSFCEVYTSKSNNVVDKSTFAAAAFFYLN